MAGPVIDINMRTAVDATAIMDSCTRQVGMTVSRTAFTMRSLHHVSITLSWMEEGSKVKDLVGVGAVTWRSDKSRVEAAKTSACLWSISRQLRPPPLSGVQKRDKMIEILKAEDDIP